jgi:PAS domain S-box-containing protein
MILAIGVFVMAAVMMYLVIRRWAARGAACLLAFAITLIAWAGAYAGFLYGTPATAGLWLSLVYLASTLAATSLLIFTLFYTNHGDWVTRWTLLVLAIEPVLTQVIIWEPRWRGLFFTTRTEGLGLVLTTGPWYWINQTYSDGLVVLALIFLAQTFQHKSKQYLYQSVSIAIGLFIPIVVKIVSLAGFTPFPNMDLAPFAFGLTALFLSFSIFRYKLLDIAMISRDMVVEAMSDGWMVTDNNNRIVDLNPAAEALLGVPREDLFGQPADQIMSNWPKLNLEPSAREVEIRGSLKLHGEWRFLNVRILPLVNPAEKQVGSVVLWRDITERKRSDDARQSARDEMFVLLHSISGAASQTLKLNDFLSEATHQITYTFQSQVGLIFLRESGLTDAGFPKYSLAAQHGIPPENIPHLTASPQVAQIIAWVLKSREPFFVPDVMSEPRLPASMQQSGNRSMLLVPLVTAQQVLGVLGLSRMEGPPAPDRHRPGGTPAAGA